MAFYDILDFKAVTKHSFYGCKRNAKDNLICPETGDEVPRWETAANDLLSRYFANFDNFRNVIVAHDMGMDYRKAIFPGYKEKRGNREVSELEKQQIKKLQSWAKSLLAALGTTQIGVKGVEADDVIAWICQGEEISGVVHTVDADLLELVSEDIVVSLKGEHYYFGDEYKNYPTEITSVMKSMLGDTSDEYGGIHGFGPAKMTKLYEQVGKAGTLKLQSIVDSGDARKLEEFEQTKEIKMLSDNWGTWMTMWKLAKLHPELCWKPRARKLTKPTLHKRVPDAQKTYDLLNAAGASDLWAGNYEQRVPAVMGVENAQWQEMLPKIQEEMLKTDVIAFDYETTDKTQMESFVQANPKHVDMLSQVVTGVSFCFGENLQYVIYVPVDHKETDNVPTEEIKKLLIWIRTKGLKLCAHNFYFEGTVSRTNYGIIIDDVRDTQIMQRYFDENSPAGLKSMSLQYLNYEQDSYEDTLKAAGVERMNELTLAQVVKYGADDSLVTAHLYDLLKLMLRLDGQWKHYEKWCIEPTQALQSAYVAGVKIDWDLQKRIHEHDLNTIEVGMKKLRNILSENVTGEVTDGCESLIKEESKFINRSYAERYPEDFETKISEWKSKLRKACVYHEYEEHVIHPEFKYTAKQLSNTAVDVGLPAIEKITLTGLAEYFDALGVSQMESTEYSGKQAKFIELLQEAVTQRVDKLAKEETFMRRRAFDALAEFCLANPAREPKIVKTGDELNVGSSTQMQQLLYCKIGVPVRLFGDLGIGRLKYGIRQAAPSTDEKAIETALVNDAEEGTWQREALKTLLSIKSANTRCTLFHNKLPLWKHVDGRVHPGIRDTGTDTRRPTGSDPNILQIPSKGWGRVMRSMYIPPHEDWVTVAIDFSGQELRIIACESQDPNMLLAYTPGNEKDIHTMTAVGIAVKMAVQEPTLKPLTSFEEFSKARKDESHPLHGDAESIRGSKAKGCNFNIAFGGGAGTLAKNIIVPFAEAEMMFEGTLSLYSRIRPWQEETAKFMTRNGFTLTGFGTKRHATDNIFSNDKGAVARVHRQGTNATIQGTAAEMLKMILTRLHKEEWLYSIRMEFFAPIYDEVVSFVHKDDVVEYCNVMQRLMSEANPEHYQVPQVPEFSIGADWGRCHELGREPSAEAINAAVQVALEERKIPVEL